MQHAYARTKLRNVINITEIVTIHYYEFDNSFVFKGEQHDFWEMVYVDSGAVEIQRGEETVILKQGDILFHEPNEFHAIRSHNSSPNIFVISFVCHSPAMNSFKRLHALLNKTLKPFISSIIIEAESTYVIPKNDVTLKRLTAKADAPLGGEQLIKTYLEQFLIILMRSLSEKKEISFFPSRESMETHIISEIKKYLEANVTNRITIQDVCAHFGYSKTNLSVLFKSQCNTTIIKYYNRKKIEYAKKRIRENRYNITQISDMLGFDNPQYFARTFKRVTGMTPTEFIRSLRVSDPI